jgi:peptidoglycan/LPS O-acetylase OafA/YrhL
MSEETRDTSAPRHPGGKGYRPEVDGLRALAVMPVILFHAGLEAFGGGYVGVDVFFVISGYLITTIILEERLSGRFTLAGFYERRARRILPALFLTMLLCVPLAWRWMIPAELIGFGQSVIAVVLFLSNVLFWRTSGYFGGDAELEPLLHTWSLGIEEQYYIIFPLLVALLLRFRLKRATAAIAAIAIGSIAISVATTNRQPLINFFLLPPRAWELLSGSLLALASAAGVDFLRASRLWREAAGIAGFALILVPVLLYNEATPFPGLAALPPILGTVLILAFTDPGTIAGRLLTLQPMLLIGLISYSAYLLHQPLFAFARLMSTGHPPPWTFLLLTVLSLTLAWLSWRYVEAPFRSRHKFSRRSIFGMATAGSLFFIAVGTSLVLGKGAPWRFTAADLPLVAPVKSMFEGCPAGGYGIHICHLGMRGTVPTIALVGDSHSYAIGPTLDAELRRRGLAGILVHTDCHPIPGIFDSREPANVSHREQCAAANRAMEARVTAPEIEAVIVAVRWTMRLYPMDGAIDQPRFDNGEGGIEGDAPYRRNLTFAAGDTASDAAQGKTQAVRAYLERLSASKPTVVIYPVPEAGWLPQRLNMVAIRRDGRPREIISTSHGRYIVRNHAAIAALDAATSPNLHRLLPEELFCDIQLKGRCVIQTGGVLYYYDDDHVSAAGARLIVDQALALIPNLRARAP